MNERTDGECFTPRPLHTVCFFLSAELLRFHCQSPIVDRIRLLHQRMRVYSPIWTAVGYRSPMRLRS